MDILFLTTKKPMLVCSHISPEAGKPAKMTAGKGKGLTEPAHFDEKRTSLFVKTGQLSYFSNIRLNRY